MAAVPWRSRSGWKDEPSEKGTVRRSSSRVRCAPREKRSGKTRKARKRWMVTATPPSAGAASVGARPLVSKPLPPADVDQIDPVLVAAALEDDRVGDPPLEPEERLLGGVEGL